MDLVIASLPNAGSLKETYEAILPNKYVEWFSLISQQLLRVLKQTGFFILNFKERVVNGGRHTCVLAMSLEMKNQA